MALFTICVHEEYTATYALNIQHGKDLRKITNTQQSLTFKLGLLTVNQLTG